MRIVKNYLSHLDKISVREADLLSFVQKLGYNDASLDMDPTFLLLKTDWDKLIPEKPCGNDRYIL